MHIVSNIFTPNDPAESEIEQGRRPELLGGGLIRSLGGWKAVKNARFSGQLLLSGTPLTN